MTPRSAVAIREHPLIKKLLTLKLDPNDFVIFGSAPLLTRGLRDEISDLDIVARGEAWVRARELADHRFQLSLHSLQPMLTFFDGLIEIYPQWIDDTWSVDTLIDDVDIIGGLRFARLRRVLAYKRKLDRKKDRADILRLERYLFGDHPSLIRNHMPPIPLGARQLQPQRPRRRLDVHRDRLRLRGRRDRPVGVLEAVAGHRAQDRKSVV